MHEVVARPSSVAQMPALATSVPPSKKRGLQSNSIIEPMAAKAKPLQSAPKLTPPLKHFSMQDQIKLLQRFEEIGGRLTTLTSQALDEKCMELKALTTEQAAKLKEKAENSQKSGVWDLLKKIGACILAAISAVFGMSLVAAGSTVIGGLLIASGVLAIVNLVMTETECWDWIADKIAHDNKDLAKKLKIILPATVSAISAIMGLAGTAGALYWTSLDWAKKVVTIAQTAANIAYGVTTIGKGYSDGKLSYNEGQITAINHKMAVLEHSIEMLMQRMQSAANENKQITKELANMVQLYNSSIQLTHQA